MDGTVVNPLVAVLGRVPQSYACAIQPSGKLMPKPKLDDATLGEIVEMALSDSASFANIKAVHGLDADEVRAVMRQSLKPGSYRAWRKRVRQFSDRREIYK